MPSLEIVAFALAGGILPVLIWLFFWLKEDRERPEPKKLIARIFFAGALAVIAAYPLEILWCQLGYLSGACQGLSAAPVALITGAEKLLLVAWALTEEVLKFLAAYIFALRSRHFDEPVDAMIYLITAALGFAALENSLFLFNALSESGSSITTLLTGNFRFLGANVIHTISSAVIGGMVGLSFKLGRGSRILYASIGLFTATALHAMFNFLIITTDSGGVFKIFAMLWLLAILIILLFERVKVNV